MGPVIDQLATEFAGRATVGKVNVDEQPALAQQYGIRSIPALLVFKHGHVVDQAVGITSQQVLSALLEAQLETA
jgi:thioredoxin 1